MTTTSRGASALHDVRAGIRFDEDDAPRLLRFGAVAGVLYAGAIGFAIWFLLTTHPAFDATPVEAARGFRDEGGKIALSTLLLLLPTPFVLLFLGGLSSVLRRAGTALTAVVLCGAVLDLALFATGAVASSITATIGALDTGTAAGAVIKAVDGIHPAAIAAAGLARACVLVGGAIQLRRLGLAGRTFAGFSFAVAGLGLLGAGTILSAALFPVTELAMVLAWAWMTVVALRLPRALASR